MSSQKSNVRIEAERFIAVAIILGIIVAALVTPPNHVERAWAVQQESTQRWVGPGIDTWAWRHAYSGHQKLAHWMRHSMRSMEDTSINRWLANRAYVILLWAGIAWYRLMVVLVWMLFAIPLMLAALADGALTREIRKTSFNTPSPALHNMGLSLWKLAMMVLLLWMIVPYDMPSILVPAMILVMATSVWAWVAHMQKRV